MSKIERVKLSSETRKRLIRAYIERCLAKDGKLPSRREVEKTIGGDVYSILEVLREFRNNRT